MTSKRPLLLVKAVFACLSRDGKTWTRVLEPTCGRGAFIAGAMTLNAAPREIFGIEIQEDHVATARALAQPTPSINTTILQQDIFTTHLRKDIPWEDSGPLLVIGNPPWVTNAELGTLGSKNLPKKTNLKNLPGFAAMTGDSNFDIAEYIWLKLLRELAHEHPTVALLCKTATARNVLLFAATIGLPLGGATIRRIDAKRWFNVSVDACLFTVDVGQRPSKYEIDVYTDLESTIPTSTIGVVDGKLIANVDARSAFGHLDGRFPFTWRQGLKHDAASVVELTYDDKGNLANKHGEPVQVESDYIYPLLKGSDVGGKRQNKPMRAIILPQKRLGDLTHQLAYQAPQLWSYLEAHRAAFDQRKSSIYRRQPPFAYFGLGDYCFSQYKVAISGMHKTPVFRAIGPRQGRPVMFDDTCYFVSCSSGMQAALIASLLNDPMSLAFLNSIAFWDAKRPITKKLLQRIDLIALLHQIDRSHLMPRANATLAELEDAHHAEYRWPASLESVLMDSSIRQSDVTQPALFVHGGV